MSDKPMIRVSCYNCQDGLTGEHDCGEDTCCCLDPEPNVVCDVCDGKGYWLVKDTPEAIAKLSKSDLEWEPLLESFGKADEVRGVEP